jgi:hypothetical protein
MATLAAALVVAVLAGVGGCYGSWTELADADLDTATPPVDGTGDVDADRDGSAEEVNLREDARPSEDRGFEDAPGEDRPGLDDGDLTEDAGSGCVVAARLAIAPSCPSVEVPASVPTVTVCGSYTGYLLHVTRGDTERGYARVTAHAAAICVAEYAAGGPDLCECLPAGGYSACQRDDDGDGLARIGVDLPAGWPRAVSRPGLPQIRTCPTRASGSSDYGFAA